jgi:hypothetical protein
MTCLLTTTNNQSTKPPNTQTARPSGPRRLRPLCARRCPSGAAHALCLSLSRNHMTAAPNSITFHDKIAHLSSSSPPPLRAQRHEQQVLHATDRWLTTTHCYPLTHSHCTGLTHTHAPHRLPATTRQTRATPTSSRASNSQPPRPLYAFTRTTRAIPPPSPWGRVLVCQQLISPTSTIPGLVQSSPKHRNLTATLGSKGASLTAIESVEHKTISTLLHKVS